MARDESSFPRAVPVPPWSETRHGQSRRERIPHGALQPRIPERSGGMGVISCAATHFNSHCAAHSPSISISICWLTGYGVGFSNHLSLGICGSPAMQWGSVPSLPHGPAAAMMTPQTGVVGGGGYFVHLQAAKRAMAHHSSISGLAKEPLSGHHKASRARLQWIR